MEKWKGGKVEKWRGGEAESGKVDGAGDDVEAVIGEMTTEMLQAADALEFERAAYLRDQIAKLKKGGRSRGKDA